MNHLYLVGDQHGDMNSLYHTVQTTRLEKGDYLAVLGDFGFIWNGEWEKRLYKISNMTEGTIFVILGNHENYDIINKKFRVDWDSEVDNYVYHPSSNVKIVFDGGMYNLCGKKCFCVNGADSTDRLYRIVGESWWPQECLNFDQMDSIIAQADRDSKADLVLSHCTSATVKRAIWPNAQYPASTMEKFMEEIYSKITFDEAYFGHYHDEKTLDKYHCLYRSWVQIC